MSAESKITFLGADIEYTAFDKEAIATLALLDEPYVGERPASTETGYLTDAPEMLCVLNDKKIVGKAEYKRVTSTVCAIKWISARGYGKVLFDELESRLVERGVETVHLVCAVDEAESKVTVVHRVNFYISRGYQVDDITYHMNPDYDTDGKLRVAVQLHLYKKLY